MSCTDCINGIKLNLIFHSFPIHTHQQSLYMKFRRVVHDGLAVDFWKERFVIACVSRLINHHLQERNGIKCQVKDNNAFVELIRKTCCRDEECNKINDFWIQMRSLFFHPFVRTLFTNVFDKSEILCHVCLSYLSRKPVIYK